MLWKGFMSISNLREHEKIHNDLRPYECETCGEKFNVNSSLKSHARIHIGEKSYHCELCKKWFSSSNHERIHTGDNGSKIFRCDICSKTFKTRNSLKIHNLGKNHLKKIQFETNYGTVSDSKPLKLQ